MCSETENEVAISAPQLDPFCRHGSHGPTIEHCASYFVSRFFAQRSLAKNDRFVSE